MASSASLEFQTGIAPSPTYFLVVSYGRMTKSLPCLASETKWEYSTVQSTYESSSIIQDMPTQKYIPVELSGA